MGEKRGTASDYWEDKDSAVLGLTAPSTSGVPHPSLQAHHPIPSTQGNFLLLTTHPSFIYPSIHLSFPQQMEIITRNNEQLAVPLFSNLTSKSKLLCMTGLLIRPLKSVPVVERDMSESRKECNWQVLVRSRHPVCQRIPYSAGQQSRRLHERKYSVSQTKLVLHYIRLIRHFETTGQLSIELKMKHLLIKVHILKISKDRSCCA